MKNSSALPLSTAVASYYSAKKAIRKEFRLKLPDAMIAANAIVHNLTLLSLNPKDFKSIPILRSLIRIRFENVQIPTIRIHASICLHPAAYKLHC